MPAVYDDEKEKTGIKPHHDGSHDDLGVHPERREAEAQDLENLYNAESSAESGSGGKAEDREQEKLDDQVGKGYVDTDKKEKKGRGWSNRKKGALAGILVTAAVGAGGLGFIAAPSFIVNHLRELLMGKVNELQTHQSRRYRRTKFNKAMDRFSRDGRKSGAIIAEMEANGYTVSVDPNNRNRITGVTPPGSDRSYIGMEMSNEIESYMDKRHPFRSARWKTKRMEAFYRRNKIPRVSPIRRAARVVDDMEVEVNKRMAGTLLEGDNVETRGSPAAASDGESDTDTAAREARNEALESLGESDGSLDDIKQRLKNGEPISKFSREDIRLMRVGLDDLDQELVDILNNLHNTGIGGRVVRGVTSLATGVFTELTDKVCTIKARLRAVIFAGRVWRARILMQYASLFVTASDESRTGKIDSDAMNELMKRITSNDDNGMPIGASPAFAYMLNGKFSKSHNEAYKGNFGVDGSLVGIPAAVHDVTNKVPGVSRGQCAVWQNPGFQIGSSVLELGISIFTGGTARGASFASKEAMKTAFNTAIKNVVSKQTLKSLATYAAIDLTFEGVMAFISMYAERSLTLPVTGQEKGATLGYLLPSGAGAMHKQRNLEAGMVPATETQYAQAQQEYIAWKKEQNKNKSFYARVLDYENYDSLTFNLASLAMTTPTTPRAIGLSVGNSLTRISSLLANPAKIISTVANSTLSDKTYAQASDEVSFGTYTVEGGDTLATDPAGNLLPVMRTDVENIDPEANIEWLTREGQIDPETLEPKDEFARHYENCVANIDTLSILENEDQNKPEYDCLAKKSRTVRYKAHLAYLDLLDGVDAWLFPEEIKSSAGGSDSGGTGPGGVPPTPGQKATKEVDTSGLSCAGTPSSERIVEIVGGVKRKLCDYGTIRSVDASWSQSVSSMIAAATADGISLGPGGGFRSAAGQIEARRRNCGTSHYAIYEMPSRQCRPPTARPGQSNHELGLAIDFENMCYPRSTCSGNARYDWLVANAGRFGVKKLSSEAWHWSIDGH